MDLIVFGATAFTGRLACQYLARHAPGLQWAIAGRNQAKLEAIKQELANLPHPPQAMYGVDQSDRARVREVVGKTRAVLSFAGPFAEYGESVVAACAELGVHYLDITGETLWIRDMINRYEETAQKSGAVLIPFSGFDSVPSDLGTWEVLEQANKKGTHRVDRIVSLFSARGGFNGGTFATALNMMEREDVEDLKDPMLLVPKELPRELRLMMPQKERQLPVTVAEEGVTAPPFFMSIINSRVVYRSQALRKVRLGESYAPFQYQELLKPPRPFSRALSWGILLSGEAFQQVGKFKAGRRLLRKIGPKPGQGPSEKVREEGFFKVRFYAYQGKKLVARTEISCEGDPGNKATVMMACESALELLQKGKDAVPGGFWTPSTALGAALRDRLARAGMEFKTLV